MTDDKAAMAIAKAQRAAELLESDVFTEALASLNAELTKRVFETKDDMVRNRAIDLVNALGKLKDGLQSFVNNGKWEKRRIDELMGERARRAS